MCLLTDGYVNTTGYRRLSLRTGLRANWNAGSWTGWFTIDCLFPLPNNSPPYLYGIYRPRDEHQHPISYSPSIFDCSVLLLHQSAACVSSNGQNSMVTNTHYHSSLHPYPLIFTFRLRLSRRESGVARERQSNRLLADGLCWLDREETTSRPAEQTVNSCSHKSFVTCRQSHFAVLCC